MSNGKFDPEKYRDEYRLRGRALLNEKVKGHEITIAPRVTPRKSAPPLDLLDALKRSIKAGGRAKGRKEPDS